MDYQLTPNTEQQQKTLLSSAQIRAVRILKMSQEELQQTLTREAELNPALECQQNDLCPECHRQLNGRPGDRCECVTAQRATTEKETRPDAAYDGRDDSGDMTQYSARGSGNFDDDDDDPMSRIGGRAEYGAGLLLALRVMVDPKDAPIAEYLVGSIDSYGLLPEDIVNEIADTLDVSEETVEHVLASLQTLEPAGIGARSAREALLLQIARLRDQNYPRNLDLAEKLIRDHFEDLAAKHFRPLAKKLGTTARLIEIEHQFIGKKLSPFPAHGFDPDLSGVANSAPLVRPDVVIRRTTNGFEADIIEQMRWSLRINDSFREARQQINQHVVKVSEDDRQLIKRSINDAKSLMIAMHHRWATMQKVANALIDLQRDYIESGPSGLKPLTRKDVGTIVKLHESTVSRATDGKYVLLPNGKTVPFDDFFNESLNVKEAITELIDSEDPRHPYSDEQLTNILRRRGMDVARRTVAKYREELHIMTSRMRRDRVGTRERERTAVLC
jgi:RNA polymerase sigma-54 factor